jgi:hypothetical protein
MEHGITSRNISSEHRFLFFPHIVKAHCLGTFGRNITINTWEESRKELDNSGKSFHYDSRTATRKRAKEIRTLIRGVRHGRRRNNHFLEFCELANYSDYGRAWIRTTRIRHQSVSEAQRTSSNSVVVVVTPLHHLRQ